MNGLLALDRCDVEATIVLLNNDDSNIVHNLPNESLDSSVTEQFNAPHGLDFSATEILYDLDFERVDLEGMRDAYAEAAATPETTVLEVQVDAEQSQRTRQRLQDRVVDWIQERR
jgi:2-succinyl-5-enolpyruvyl-6-hydroxy-3-cyclohexene-1-carboxylate synthase